MRCLAKGANFHCPVNCASHTAFVSKADGRYRCWMHQSQWVLSNICTCWTFNSFRLEHGRNHLSSSSVDSLPAWNLENYSTTLKQLLGSSQYADWTVSYFFVANFSNLKQNLMLLRCSIFFWWQWCTHKHCGNERYQDRSTKKWMQPLDTREWRSFICYPTGFAGIAPYVFFYERESLNFLNALFKIRRNLIHENDISGRRLFNP